MIIFCLFSGNIYLSLGVSVSLSTVSELFCSEVFKTFVILLAILLPIKSPATSADFELLFFEAVSRTSYADCLA